MSPAGKLTGKVCVVTGSSGMAADAARAFAAEGGDVVVIGIDKAQCIDIGLPYEVADLRDEQQTHTTVDRPAAAPSVASARVKARASLMRETGTPQA